MKFVLIAILSLMVCSLTVVNVYADSITVSTNKQILTEPFEKFLIEGVVKSISSPVKDVTIKIFDPTGKLVYSPTVTLASNGEFVNVARVDSSWKTNGVYTIEVINEKLGVTTVSQIDVQVSGNVAGPAPVLSKMQVSGLTIEHNSGVSFASVDLFPESKSITLMISNQNSNQLTLRLPQNLITDPKTVIVDGTQISNFKITKSGEVNTLTIPLNPNSKQIEIIGTSVIPEFGSITIITLAVAITTVVLVMRKSIIISPKLFNH